MDNSGYVGLTRQTGLLHEMRLLANNVANANTTGFRAQGLGFSEFVQSTGVGQPSLSMATARVEQSSWRQGALDYTGGTLDLAIEGDGFFLIGTPDGERLTRAGHFTVNAQGEMVTSDGYNVLDPGGAPVFVPATNGPISIGADGTLSVNGVPSGQVAVVRPVDMSVMTRVGATLFDSPAGWEPVDTARVQQGALESSNVDVMGQIARMVDVQRAYELGQNLLDREDQRISRVIETLGR